MPLATASAICTAEIQPPVSPESNLDYRFLLPIGVAQLIGALWRLLVGGLMAAGSESAGFRLLTVTASFLLYSLTGAAILLTRFTNQLARLKPRATGCLVLCSLSAVFTVFEMHQQLTRAVAESEQTHQLSVNSSSGNSIGLTGDSDGKRIREILKKHRIVMLVLLLLQCVIVTIASYLCVKLMWTTPVGSEGGGDSQPDEAEIGASATAAAAAESLAGNAGSVSGAEEIELKTQL